MARNDSFERQWRARFSDFAKQRDDDAGIAGWSETGLEARLRAFRRAWAVVPRSGVWLDAGCGAGSYLRLLADADLQTVGVDYSYVTVLKARDRVGGISRLLTGDATALPFQPASFDGVLLFGVTQALSDSRPVIRELATATKSGGQVWLDGLNSWCIPHVFERIKRRLLRRPVHVRYESPFRLRRYVRDYGLCNVRLIWLPILPGRLQRFQSLLESRFGRWIFERIPGVGALFSHSMIVVGDVVHDLSEERSERNQ